MDQKPSFFSRLPVWAKIVFILFYPVSIPYGVYRMWKTKKLPVSVRWFATAAAVCFLFAMIAGGQDGGSVTPESSLTASAVENQLDTSSTSLEETPSTAETTAVSDVSDDEVQVSAIEYEIATVIRIVDGDTVEVQFENGSKDKVRFIGVDTPEETSEVEIYGEEATEYTSSQLLDRTVYLEYDADTRDHYDRLLAYIWLELPTTVDDSQIRECLFNAQLLLDGYANLMTVQPNSKYVDYLKTYEAEARDANLGLWAAEAEAAAATEKENQADSSSGDMIVYITDTGTKYHKDGCQYLRDSQHAITLSEAIAQGYEPCSKCFPSGAP